MVMVMMVMVVEMMVMVVEMMMMKLIMTMLSIYVYAPLSYLRLSSDFAQRY